MMVTSYLIDLLLLFISLQVAILFRLHLPIGSTIPTAPAINALALLLLALMWGAMFLTQHLVTEKLHKKAKILLILAFGLFFSIAEYFIISIDNVSFSRLFLAFFFITNLFGLYVSGKLALLAQEYDQWLSDQAQKMWETYNSVNNAVYKYYVEVIVAVGVGVIWGNYIHKMGLTITSDGITYLRVALRFVTNGEFLPGTNPPLYPLLISAVTIFTKFPADGAAIVSIACLILVFLIFAFLLRRFSRNTIANILLILLLATFRDFILPFQNAWTEPLYTVFLIANFFLLVKHQSNPKWIYLIGASLLVVFAMVTRFIGITMGAMLVLYVLILSEPEKQFLFRVKKYIFPALLAFIPFTFLLWVNANLRQAVLVYLAGRVSQRGLLSYLIGNYSIPDMTIRFLKAFWETAGQPYIIFTLALILIIVFFRVKEIDQKSQRSLKFLVFFLFGYLALTIIAFSVTKHVPTQTRYWTPLLPFAFLAMAQTTDLLFMNKSLLFAKSVVLQTSVFVLLLILPLYSLIIQSGGAENILVDRVRDAGQNSLFPVQEGFNLSPTSEAFRNFFVEISRQNNQNTIVVIEGDFNWTTMAFESDYEIAEAFLFKSRLITSPAVTQFRFLAIRHRDQILSYYVDGQYSELHLQFPSRENISALIPQLEQSNQGQESTGVYFIVNHQWFDLFANEIFGEELEKLQPSATIEPYLVFVLKPAQMPID